MDALKFLKERKRMCSCYKHCEGCPLEELNCALNAADPDEDNEQVIAAVEQWSKEHPFRTRQNVFLEQYPDAVISDDGLPYVAPCQLYAGLIHGESIEDCENRGLCADCRREFWTQEMEGLGVDPCKPPHKPIN